MNAVCLIDLPTPPEWRRSGHFFLLALVLHAAILFYPLHLAIGKIEPPLPQSIAVRLIQSVAPLPAPAVRPQASEPAPSKTKAITRQRPILSMPSAAANDANSLKIPDAPPAPVVLAAPPAPTPSAPAAPVASISPARFDAAYLHNPEPKYPPLSRRLGEEGKVLLKVRVTPEGLPATVDIEKSSNFERLDEAARQTVARWRFAPAKRGDQAIEASVIVPIVFRLEA